MLIVIWRARNLALATGIWLLPAVAQNPDFRAETRIVEVAIVARDAQDAAVEGLAADDFQVFDNGVEQKIQSFDKLWDPPRAPNGLPIGLPPKRPTVIVIDRAGQTALEELAEMLHELPQTVDRIAIFALGNELKMVHDFSPFTGALRTAVLEYEPKQTTVPEPNWLAWRLKMIQQLAHDMKDMPGEKNMIWISAGFPGPADLQEVAGTVRELAAARVILYPVDTRGFLATGKAFENVDAMRELVGMTGGRVYYNSFDIAGLLRQAIDDSRDAYMLSYAPSNYEKDGSVHEVKLKLKTERKGVELHYRPAYVADGGK